MDNKVENQVKNRMKNISKVGVITAVVAMTILAMNPLEAEAKAGLNKKSITMAVGKTYMLKTRGTKGKAIWKTSRKGIARISKRKRNQVRITAVKAGKAVVSAKINGKTYKCMVTVVNPKLDRTKATLTVGQKTTLKVTGGTGTVKWKSVDESVATVTNKGVVTAKSTGTTKITATVNGKAITATITVQGKKASADTSTPTPPNTPTPVVPPNTSVTPPHTPAPITPPKTDAATTGLVFSTIKGSAILQSQETALIESSSDLNSVLEYVNLSMSAGKAKIETVIEQEVVIFEPQLHQSMLGNNAENSIFGIDETIVSGIQLVKFSIEKEVEEFSLLKPNFHMRGQTVVSLGFYSNNSDTTYIYQFVANELNALKVITSESELLENELVEYELANFAGKSCQEVSDEMQTFEFSFQSEDMPATGEQIDNSRALMFLKAGTPEFNILEKTPEELVFDQYIEASKKGAISLESERNARNVVTGVPNSLYRSSKSGWTTTAPAYKNGSSIGYVVYHMPAIGSKNTLNYVARFQVNTNINWNSQQFIHSFKITHNVWVQYIASSNRVYIFDDRASNARLDFKPTIYLTAPYNKTGHFTHYSPSSVSTKSKLSRIANAVIIWVPYASKGKAMTDILTSAKRTTGNTHPLNNYTKDIEGSQGKLIHPNDHVTIHGYGKNINSISYGYYYKVWAR